MSLLLCHRRDNGGSTKDIGRMAGAMKLPSFQPGQPVAESCGLGMVMSDQKDGMAGFQVENEILDGGRGMGVQGTGGLIHENYFGTAGEGTGEAQSLLLPGGEPTGGIEEAVFDFVPEGGFAQRFFGGGGEVAAAEKAKPFQAEEHVFQNAGREEHRLLE